MSASAWMQLLAFLVALLALAWPLSRWIHAVMEGEVGPLRRIERGLLKVCGVNPDTEQGWLRYALGLLVFNALGFLAVYALQRLQHVLPLNPQRLAAVSPDSAFNTAISFVTNTNWQGYGGETTMSHLTQMLALTVQNFLSAATGIAVVMALLRGLSRHSAATVGNIWADLTRATLWVLLPLSFVFAMAMAGMGVVQTLAASQSVTTLEGAQQAISLGPVASQLAIKMLGTNGGGFFNANSAHPFENPSAVTNALQMLAIFLIPAALCFVMGRQVGDMRQGWALLGAMTAIFVVAVVVATAAEQAGNPRLHELGVAGGNMEGKEVRFGIDASALFAVITTAASCGAVNAMHDSFTPLGGAV
ncbi:potassium-transporting ATPase subunit KdpA, partial [Roseateles sp. P5_E7]